LVLLAAILLIGLSEQKGLSIHGTKHMCSVACRLGIVIAPISIACIILEVDPAIVVGASILLSLLLFIPFIFEEALLPLVLITSWIVMKPGEGLQKSLVLKTDRKTKQTEPISDSPIRSLIGLEGSTLTELRPIGEIEINEEKLEAKAQVGTIRSGRQIRIVSASGSSVVVEEIQSKLRND